MSVSRDLKKLRQEELEQVVQMQQHMVQVAMGQRPMEHPNAPMFHPGQPYVMSDMEKQFHEKQKAQASATTIKYAVLGFVAPYVILRLPFIAQNTRIFKRPVLWSSIGGFMGMMYGATWARIRQAHGGLFLEGSPFATESRYQLWKINPQHPFLKSHQSEFGEFDAFERHRREMMDRGPPAPYYPQAPPPGPSPQGGSYPPPYPPPRYPPPPQSGPPSRPYYDDRDSGQRGSNYQRRQERRSRGDLDDSDRYQYEFGDDRGSDNLSFESSPKNRPTKRDRFYGNRDPTDRSASQEAMDLSEMFEGEVYETNDKWS